MTSWTLGQIYSVDEEKLAPSGSESSDDDDDDDDVLERQAAFNKNKQKNNSSVCPVTGSNRSIRRYDEFGDFLTRSERAHQEKAREASLSKIPERQGSGVKGKVSFCAPDKLEEVHEIPSITQEEKNHCFMTTDNWVSIDNDIELTTKRWTNHVEGTIPFDEDNNTIRGIEDMIFKIDKNKPIMKHRRTILEEVVRQKTANEFPNWDKLSAISKSSSETQKKLALELAKEDEKEKNRIWAPKIPAAIAKAVTPANGKKDKKDKKKGSFFGLFKKK